MGMERVNTARVRRLESNAGDERRAGDQPPGDPPDATPAPAADAPQLSATQRELAELLVATLRQNTKLNFRVRAGLAVVGFASSLLALGYAGLHGAEIASPAGDLGALFAGTLPVVLLVVFSALAGLAAWTVNARSVDEMHSTLELVNRMAREGEVAVSSRGLVHAFEEKLQNTRRAFTLLLWLGRTLFVVCLGLLAGAGISAIAHADPVLTGALGGSSLLGAFLGIVSKVPRNIASHLADVVQIQTVVTGCDRQISLLETIALHAVNRDDGAHNAHDDALAVQRQMDRVIGRAVSRIEELADPGARTSH
jgi:hypothetical protein